MQLHSAYKHERRDGERKMPIPCMQLLCRSAVSMQYEAPAAAAVRRTPNSGVATRQTSHSGSVCVRRVSMYDRRATRSVEPLNGLLIWPSHAFGHVVTDFADELRPRRSILVPARLCSCVR